MKPITRQNLKLVKEEVLSSFTIEEIKNYPSFEAFFNAVDVQNAYEEEWDAQEWKTYYLIVYAEIKEQ
jgi:ASC-1-like (ASCH) protein